MSINYQKMYYELRGACWHMEDENTTLRSDISHLNTEVASLNEQLSHIRMMLDEAEAANYHEKLREAIQAERKRWAKEDVEALRVRDIKQHIKALESSLTENSRTIPFPYNCNTDVVYSDDIKYDIEQLRKELEK